MPYFGPQVGIQPIRPLDYSPVATGIASIGQAFQAMDARKRADQQLAVQQEQLDLQKRDQAMRQAQQAASLAQMGFISGDTIGNEIGQSPMPGVQVAAPAVTLQGPTALRLPGAAQSVQMAGAPSQPSAVLRLTQGAPAAAQAAPSVNPVDETFKRLRSAMGGPQKVATGDGATMYYDPARAAMRGMAPEIAKEGLALERLQQDRGRKRAELIAAGVPEHVADAAIDNPSLQDNYLFPKSTPKDAQIQRRIAELVGAGAKLADANTQARLEFGESVTDPAQASEPLVEIADPKDPMRGIMVPRSQAVGQSTRSSTRTDVPSEGERQAAGLLPEIEDANAKMDALSPSVLSKFVHSAPIVGNYMKTDAGRQFDQLADQFITNVIYAKSGKAVTDEERKRLTATYIPQPGDDETTLEQKKVARALAMKGVYIAAGRAGKTITAPTSVPQNPWRR